MILLNSEIFVVMWVKLFIAIKPIVRQMMLDTRARTNQSNKEVRNSDGTATDLTVMNLI